MPPADSSSSSRKKGSSQSMDKNVAEALRHIEEKATYTRGSKVVRKYRSNDMATLRKAITDNLCEYLLEDLKLNPDYRVSNFRLFVSFCSVLLAPLAHFFPLPFPAVRPVLLACVLSYNLIAAFIYYLVRHVEGDAFLLTSDVPPALKQLVNKNNTNGRDNEDAASEEDDVHLFKGSAFRFKYGDGRDAVETATTATQEKLYSTSNNDKKKSDNNNNKGNKTKEEPDPPTFALEMQWLEPVGFSGLMLFPRKVRKSVTVEKNVGTFFSEDGRIYPPSVVAMTDEVIELMKKEILSQ